MGWLSSIFGSSSKSSSSSSDTTNQQNTSAVEGDGNQLTSSVTESGDVFNTVSDYGALDKAAEIADNAFDFADAAGGDAYNFARSVADNSINALSESAQSAQSKAFAALSDSQQPATDSNTRLLIMAAGGAAVLLIVTLAIKKK